MIFAALEHAILQNSFGRPRRLASKGFPQRAQVRVTFAALRAWELAV